MKWILLYLTISWAMIAYIGVRDTAKRLGHGKGSARAALMLLTLTCPILIFIPERWVRKVCPR